MSDHVTDARQRARVVFGGEGHTGAVDDWRYAALSGRNAAVLLCVVWAVLHGFRIEANPFSMLLVCGGGLAVFFGVASALVTRNEIAHLEAEIERERREIQDDREHEREEVTVLYEAKGFREPLLSQVVDVLCADDDRLLKVMMEEELGLFIRPTTHPVLVGLFNAVGAMVACAFLVLPISFLVPSSVVVWIPVAGASFVAAMAGIIARHTGQPSAPLICRWLIMGAVTVAVVHFLAQLASGRW